MGETAKKLSPEEMGLSDEERQVRASEPRINLEHGSSRTSGDCAAGSVKRTETGMPDTD